MTKIYTIFQTKEGEETEIVGQTTKNKIPEQSQIVKKITGKAPESASKTQNSSTFNVGKNTKIDFVEKDAFSKSDISD